MSQFHFTPAGYLDMIRAELPAYDELQMETARVSGDAATRVLDLGAGTGVTSQAVLRRHPNASLVLVDESAQMLAAAAAVLPADRVEQVVVGDLLDAFPTGPFDLVVSALAVHHLDAARKQHLFARIRDSLRARGRFVMADVIVPEDPGDAVTPLSADYDMPDTLGDLLTWLAEATFVPTVTWQRKDLAVVQSDYDDAPG